MFRHMVSIWIRKGKAYLPTLGKAAFGYYGIEPVHVCDLIEGDLVAAAKKVIAAGHPEVPYSKPDPKHRPLLRAAKLRSWRAMESGAVMFTIVWTEDVVEINVGDKRGVKNGHLGFDLKTYRSFAPDTPIETLVGEILKYLESSSAQSAQG